MIKAKLSNGLNLIYEQNKAVDVVSIQFWVYCGSAYEKESEYGLSHFIEHLVFKGSKKYSEEEITGTLERLGGELNAFTSKEQTCYYVTIPKENYKKGLEILEDMVFNPRFEQEAIDSERGVVVEEINRSEDNPYSVLGKQFNEAIFNGHNYAHPVLGYREIIKTVKRETLVDYHKRHYSPEKTMLAVVGNIDFEELKSSVQNIFGQELNVSELNKPKDGILDYILNTDNLQYKYEEMPINNVLLGFGFNIPNVYHKDVPALDILASILGEGDSARLVRELRLREPILNAIDISSYTPKHAGVFNFIMSLNATTDTVNRLTTAFNRIKGILLDLKDTITEEEITKAKTIFISEKAFETETASGYARKLGLMFHLKDDLSFEDEYFKALEKVSKQDVINVLNKYILNTKPNALVVLVPKNMYDKQEILDLFTKNFLEFNTPFKCTLGKNGYKITPPQFTPVKDIVTGEPKIREYKGAKLILRKINSAPLVAVKLAFEGGSRYETQKTQGIGTLLARTLFMGNAKYTTEELLDIVDKTSSSVSASSGKNSFIIRGGFLKHYDKLILDLMKESVLTPKFESPYFESEKAVIKEAIKSQEDNLPSLTRQLVLELVFQEHPYRFNTLGTLDTVDSFTTNDLMQHKNRLISADKLVASVVGDYNEETITTWFNNLVDSLAKSSERIKISSEPEQTTPRFKGFKKDTKQTNILIAYKTEGILSKDAVVLELISAMLSGQSGRLFLNLRERYSLAYVVAPLSLSGIENGYFGIYTACDDEKTELAVTKIREEFEKLKTDRVSQDELDRARNYIIGSKAIEEQRYQNQALRFAIDELLGLGYKHREYILEAINNIKASDINEVARKYFKSEKENIVIVSKTDYKDTFI